MMQAAVEAKEAAVREVAKLLTLPEDLANISTLRSEFGQRQQANDAQLSASVMSQVDKAREGMDTLTTSKATITELRDSFILIDRLCVECKNLIDHHEQIQALSCARNNLNTTIRDVEGMLSISQEAAEARASLQNDKELVRTFERLTALEGKRRFALAAVSTRKQEQMKLSEYFEDVSRTREKFEQTLFGHVKNYQKLANESPATLVRCLRIVEMQEELDSQQAQEALEADGLSLGMPTPKGQRSPSTMGGGRSKRPSYTGGTQAGSAGGDKTPSGSPKQGRGYKDRCFAEIQAAVQERFGVLLNKLVVEDLNAALLEATSIAGELPDIYDYVGPCFPPRYEIFQFVVQLYTQHFVTMLRKLGDNASQIPNHDILKIIGWESQYEDQLLSLGVDDGVAQVCAETGALDALIDRYVEVMQSSMKKYFMNMLEADKVEPPKQNDTGRLYTPAAHDLFRLFSAQLTSVQENCTGAMIWRVADAFVKVMLDFQAAQRTRFNEPVSDVGFEALCAMANNNARCPELVMELSNSVMEALPASFKDKIQFDEAIRGFMEIEREALFFTVEVIFEDPGVKKLLTNLYQKDWYDGVVSEYLVATFSDYFADIRKCLEEKSFRRFAELCLERTVLVYLDGLLMQKNHIKQATLKRMEMDEEQIGEFFKAEGGMNPKKVEKKLQPLVDIRELACSDSVESFRLTYTSMLHYHPDCVPELVEKVVALRDDVPRKEAREVVNECREIYNARDTTVTQPKTGMVYSRLLALPKPLPRKK